MRLVKRIAVGLLAFVAVAALGLLLAIWIRQDRKFEAPLPAVHASNDPAVIARGRYLVYGPAHCVGCHGDRAQRGAAHVDLSGGTDFKLPIGIFNPPNLTSSVASGIGALSDGEIARALRHGVGHDGRALFPFMPFADLSEEDLVAILSFLRAEPPVEKAVPRPRLNLLGRAVRAFVLEPRGPTRPVRATSPTGVTVERGEYLAYSVANCVGCHTNRDLMTGAFVGPPFAGGFRMGKHVSKNLTPDARTGWIRSWTEDDFVARLKSGAKPEGSPMPWDSFARMSEDDMRAIYRFLQTVPPVENDTGKLQAEVSAIHP